MELLIMLSPTVPWPYPSSPQTFTDVDHNRKTFSW